MFKKCSNFICRIEASAYWMEKTGKGFFLPLLQYVGKERAGALPKRRGRKERRGGTEGSASVALFSLLVAYEVRWCAGVSYSVAFKFIEVNFCSSVFGKEKVCSAWGEINFFVFRVCGCRKFRIFFREGQKLVCSGSGRSGMVYLSGRGFLGSWTFCCFLLLSSF